MKPRDLVLEQIHHRETEPVPFTLSFEAGVGARLDEHYGTDAWREWLPPYVVHVTTIDADRSVPLDDETYRDAFGTVWTTAGRPMHLVEPGLKSPSLEGYSFPHWETFVDDERRREALETCERYPDSFVAAGFGWGLFERPWTIRGFENAFSDMVTEQDFYEELLDRVLEMQLKFVEESLALPVDAIMFSDDWGDQRGVLVGPERWRRLLKPRLARLYRAVHEGGKIAISHCCGNVAEIMPDLIEIGLDVLQSIQPEAMDPYELKKKWGDKITFWGGLGSQSVIPFGTREAIFEEVERLCEEMARGGGYILGAAKAIQPETSAENAAAVLEAFLRFSGHSVTTGSR
jgi:uroporphyrinogen decarboxylase